jgi:hypothetical protein
MKNNLLLTFQLHDLYCVRSIRLTRVLFVVLLAASCGTRTDAGKKSSFNGLSYTLTIEGSEVKSHIESGNTVAFYFLVNGREEQVKTIEETAGGSIFSAISETPDTYKIKWHNVIIGESRSGKTEICGEKFGYQDICEATFVQRPANEQSAPNTLLLGLLDKGLQSAERVSGSEQLNLSDGDTKESTSVDLSGYAMNQINQGGTGTCLYNSTSGIIEWYRNKANNVRERLSAPDVIVRHGDAGENKIIDQSDEVLKGILPDEYLPTQKTYDTYKSWSSAKAYAKPISSKYASNRIKFPALTGNVLFMHQQPANGIRNNKFASADDMKKVREWLMVKQRPVHFFHYYGKTSIWHAVIALGWDDSRKMILIKDSLGGTSSRGTWRSVTDMQRKGYGAVGTMESESNNSDRPNQDPNTPSNNPIPADNTAPAPTDVKFYTIMQASAGRDYLYVYSSKKASKIEIQDTKGVWQPTTAVSSTQASWPTIGRAWVEPIWRTSQTEVNVRALIDGKAVTSKLPLNDKR